MMRRVALAAVLALATAGYGWLLLGFAGSSFPVERTLGAQSGPETLIHIYLELVSVDAGRDAMHVHVSIEPPGPRMETRRTPTDRDLVLVLAHDKREERIESSAQRPIQSIPVELDLYEGNVGDYPLEVYDAGLVIRCFDGSSPPDTQPKLLPIDVTVWERVLGFRLKTTEAFDSVSGEHKVSFQVQRSRAVVFFAIASYGAMAVLAGIALTVGTLTFLGVRRPEATLMGALGAIVFALPAMRNALPGSPPLGVFADVFIFVWTELAAIFSLMLVVITWARSGPSP